MATVSETIIVTVTGANPTTNTLSVLMNTATGVPVSGLPVSIPLTGSNSGTDTITVSMPSRSLTSNSAEITWQPVHGPIALAGPVVASFYPSLVNGEFPYTFGGSQPLPTPTGFGPSLNSLLFNDPTVPGNPPMGYGWDPEVYPMYSATLNSYGTIIGHAQLPNFGFTNNFYCMVVQGYFVVASAGNITFVISHDDGMFFAVGPSISSPAGTASYVSGLTSCPNVSTARLGLAFAGARHLAGNNLAGRWQNEQYVINFSAPGIYPFEIDYAQWIAYESLTVSTISGGTITPVALATPPPTGSTPTGQLRLTPTGGTPGLEIQGTVDTLQLAISGVPYTTIPYIPVLEGVTGNVYIYDNALPRFDFGNVLYPPVSGVRITPGAALQANVVNLSGDNTAWQGLFLLNYDNTPPTGFYLLTYGGDPVVPNVDVTNLLITANDIAWFDSADNSIDLFTVSSGGDLQYPIQIAYMVMPDRSGITVGGGPLLANGTAQILTVNLPKPMSPEQQGLYGTGNTVNAPTASCTGGVTVTTPPTAVLNGGGWLTGWTMRVTVPLSASSGSFQLTFGVTGTLTYLSGNSFVTGTVTYISGASALATIATTGNSYTAPTNFSFVVSGGRTGVAPNYTITGSITLTAVIFSTDNGSFTTLPGSNSFFRIHSATKTTIAAGALVSGPTPVAGGYHTTIALTTTSAFAWGTPVSLGYTATDSLSGLSVNYTDSNTYNNGNPNPGGGGGGGGGGGCFTCTVGIDTPQGIVAFGDLPIGRPFEIVNETGTHLAELVVHENYKSWMVELDGDKLVTVDHVMKMADGTWDRADEKYADLPHVWFEGTVYNLHVLSDDPADKHYILWNGDVAHNLKAAQL